MVKLALLDVRERPHHEKSAEAQSTTGSGLNVAPRRQ